MDLYGSTVNKNCEEAKNILLTPRAWEVRSSVLTHMVSNIPPLIIILEVNLINQTSALNPNWKGAESLPVNQHQLAEKMHVEKMIQEPQTWDQLHFLIT